MLRGIEPLDPPVEAGRRIVEPIRQPGMMAGDDIGDQLRHALVAAGRKLRQHRGASRGVIDADVGAGQPSLKIRRVFAEVVKQAGQIGRLFHPERRGHLRRQFGNADKMIEQALPITSVAILPGMCVIIHSGLSCDLKIFRYTLIK